MPLYKKHLATSQMAGVLVWTATLLQYLTKIFSSHHISHKQMNHHFYIPYTFLITNTSLTKRKKRKVKAPLFTAKCLETKTQFMKIRKKHPFLKLRMLRAAQRFLINPLIQLQEREKPSNWNVIKDGKPLSASIRRLSRMSFMRS